jgi:hypothetical protein
VATADTGTLLPRFTGPDRAEPRGVEELPLDPLPPPELPSVRHPATSKHASPRVIASGIPSIRLAHRFVCISFLAFHWFLVVQFREHGQSESLVV